MASSKKYSRDQYEEPLFKLSSPKLGLYLLLFGLTILFVAFSLGYVYTRAQDKNQPDGVPLPWIFFVNSILLLGTSWTMNRANRAYTEDDTLGYQRALWATFLLTLIFLAAQILGWTLYKDVLLGNNTGIGKQYLYALSGLHAAHVFGGIPFLLLFLRTAYLRMKEPVSVLVYFSDPDKRLRLQLLTTYWHFLDGLWLFLVGFFTLNWLLG